MTEQTERRYVVSLVDRPPPTGFLRVGAITITPECNDELRHAAQVRGLVGDQAMRERSYQTTRHDPMRFEEALFVARKIADMIQMIDGRPVDIHASYIPVKAPEISGGESLWRLENC